MTKKKVLVVAATSLGIGGIQSVIVEVRRKLLDDFCFDIVVFNSQGTYYQKEWLQTGKVFTIPFKTRGLGKKFDFYLRGNYLYREITKILQQEGPYDVIHCHNYFEAGIVLKAAKKLNVPIRIAHSHSCMPIARRKIHRRAYNYIYRKLILKNATTCLACSKVAGKYLFGKDASYSVIPNPVDTERFAFSPETNINPWSFIQVGRYAFPKNPIFSIKVLSEIIKSHPEAMLTLVGDGNRTDTENVKNEIIVQGIEKNVRLEPANSNIPKLLCQHNVMIFPSSFEGLGLVLIEAQSVGLKCFASANVPRESNLGLVDYLELSDGPVAWARTITNYIEENGVKRKRVDMSSYDSQRIAEQYRQIYYGELRH